jgi:hypothetical protein
MRVRVWFLNEVDALDEAQEFRHVKRRYGSANGGGTETMSAGM